MGNLCPICTRKAETPIAKDPIDVEIQQQLRIRSASLHGNSSHSESLLEKPRDVSASSSWFLGCASSLLTLVDALSGFDLLISRKKVLSGWLLILFAVLPSWVHGVDDAIQKRWGRFVCSLLGFSSAFNYSGYAASPEVGLIASALGALPTLMVTSAASDLNTDLLIGGKVTDISECLLIIVALVSGISLAAGVCECRDCVIAPRTSWTYFTYLATYFAMDALFLVTVVGLVGAQFCHLTCFTWCLCFWICFGLLPTLYAPPYMPTLEPNLPTEGWTCVVHRLGASILMATSAPLAYAPMISQERQKVWAYTTLARALFLCMTVCYDNIDVDTDDVTIAYMAFMFASLVHSITASIWVLCR